MRDTSQKIQRDIVEREKVESALGENETELDQQIKRQEALLRINRAVQEMVRASDLEKVIQICLDEIKSIGLDVQAMAIHRMIEPEQRAVETFRVGPEGTISASERRRSAFLTECWRTGCVNYEVYPGAESDVEASRLWGRFDGLKILSALDVPFSRGVFSVHSVHLDAFSESDVEVLKQVAEIFSVSISRSEDMERLEARNQALQKAHGELERRVEERTTDLKASNEQLQKEIVERKQMEKELQESNRRLEEALTELKTTQQQMMQQERLAAVGQLAAGIAHDFNNLLTTIMAFAELLEMRDDIPDDAKEGLKVIFSQGQRASQLIRQILDFSRKTVAQRQPVDLLPFLKETVKMLKRTLSETIQIVAEFDREEYIVEANPTQLHQILTNLSINSQDAMPRGGELRIGLTSLQVRPDGEPPLPGIKPGNWVILTVSDTGTGMAPEVVEHVYEPFFTTKQPGEGTGLGLSQVYGIVKQHSGEIAVESEERKGTTFRIYLPEFAEAETSIEQPEDRLQQGRGETILVAEDEMEVRLAIKIMLERLNYRVLTAATGLEALEVYSQHRGEIRLVLADMVMPELGGVDLFEMLEEKNARVPVVLMTAYPLGEQGNTQAPSGVAGCLEKPLTMVQVAQVVSESLNDR